MKDDKLYLIHIGECISKIEQYTTSGHQEFRNSTLIQDAVLRNLQMLAESTQRISDSLKATHSRIDWKRISGFRNVLVHNYLGVDAERVWEIVEHDLPQLKAEIGMMSQELNDE